MFPSSTWERGKPRRGAPAGGKVQKVRQQGTELDFDLEGGTPVKIATAEAASSLMLRDRVGKLEYAD